jgi:hypothetical protein
MIARWFRDTFYIYRRFDAANWAASPWTYVTSFRGFIQPAGASLATKNGAANPSAMFTIYCPVNIGIEIGDRVEDTDGATYIVMDSQKQGVAGTDHHQELSVERETV